QRHRARDVGRLRKAARADEAEGAERGHELRSVDERQALLRQQRRRREARTLERVPSRQPLAVEPRLTLADQREGEMGERGKVAARADRAPARDDRKHAAVEALEQQLDELGPRARAAFRERVRAQQHRRPDDLVRVGGADTARVAAQQAQLELLGQLLGNRLRDEAAEAGVDAVRVLAAPVGGAVDHRSRRLHPFARGVSERRPPALDGDRPHVVDRQVVARQGAMRDHAASLAPAVRYGFRVADPVTAVPEEGRELPPAPPALRLLKRHDFRNLFLAISASELGDALQYIALMWVALRTGGPLGVIAVRLADSVPALLFGLHGGLVADRWDRRSVMVAADLVRGATLIPIAVAGLTGHLPLWALVVAAFLLEAATSYFEPAYGALVPSLVDRANVQQANALVQASAQAISIGGWALGAALLVVLPISTFFAVNAASFFVSAVL